MMLGQMMNYPLTITSVMNFADRVCPDTEIVSVTADNPRHRYTFRDAFRRVRQLANVLKDFGVEDGQRIGTLAWNDYRHFELYYAISCSGQVCHTVNPRLFPEQLVYIINHAEDQLLFIDPAFVPLLEKIHEQLETVKAIVVLTDEAHMPDTSLENAHCYETLLAGAADTFEWPELEENTASSLCYTSGTTGHPKGVLYSHRSTVLHSMAVNMKDTFGLGAADVVMPIVPMFHVNAWGTPYSAVMSGSKMVFPGPKMGDGATLAALINSEKVNYSLGVPTVWLALVNYLEESGETIEPLQRVVVGGAACPLSLLQAMEKHGVWMHVAWGMTEMSPLGTYNTLLPWMESLPGEEKDVLRQKAGRLIYGVDMKIVDEQDNEMPWDGESAGRLLVRGPWISNGYYRSDSSEAFVNGWFDTGDVATIDPHGFMAITDRTKDVIKSGGEWISSIEVENAAMGHPEVQEAAVIGVPHPKWTERPLLIVVPKKDASPDKKAILQFLDGKIAKWWIPDDCVLVEKIPHTATGKISKKDLREQFKDYRY